MPTALSILFGLLAAIVIAERLRARSSAPPPSGPQRPAPSPEASADRVATWSSWPSPGADAVRVLSLLGEAPGHERGASEVPYGALFARTISTHQGELRLFTLRVEDPWAGPLPILLSLPAASLRSVEAAAALCRRLRELLTQARDLGDIITQSGSGRWATIPADDMILNRFNTIYFQLAAACPGVAAAALQAQLLTPLEGRVVEQVSPARILSRLGAQTRWFPTPCWAEPSRAEVASAMDDQSLLGQVAQLKLLRSFVGMELAAPSAPSEGDPDRARISMKGTIVLGLHPLDRERIRLAMAELDENQAFALVPPDHPFAEMALVWPEINGVTGIRDGQAPCHTLAATALLLSNYAVDRSAFSVIEDAFAVVLRQEPLDELLAALSTGAPLLLKVTDEVSLEVRHLVPELVSASGARLQHPRGLCAWLDGVQRPVSAHARPPELGAGELRWVQYMFLSPDHEIRARLSTEQLVDLMRDLESRLGTALHPHQVHPSMNFVLHGELKHDGTLSVAIFGGHPLHGDLGLRLADAARAVRAPGGDTGALSFEVWLALGAVAEVGQA